jgi:hypothetical protein
LSLSSPHSIPTSQSGYVEQRVLTCTLILRTLLVRIGSRKASSRQEINRPVLGAVALKAPELNEYNDNLFNLMPRTFPYNWFTRSIRNVFSSRSFRAYVHGTRKHIKRQIFPEHMALLLRRQDELTQSSCMLWVRKPCLLRICGPTGVVNGACGMMWHVSGREAQRRL